MGGAEGGAYRLMVGEGKQSVLFDCDVTLQQFAVAKDEFVVAEEAVKTNNKRADKVEDKV